MHVTRAALLAGFSLGVASGCGGSPCGDTEGKVTRVIDGDTIELESGVKIRYLMVDTPETTGSVDDCYGPNALQYNTDLVLNKTVQLSFDEQCTDRYGRTLAYVTVDGQEVNSLLVRNGFACVLYIPPNGQSRVEEFNALQLDAKTARRGLWSACNPLPPACT
ncbi:MAG TPA: thermonuclease family protein [Kofleriaceae bacterium]|nr:thermonuclease family protein [Kofleriaceae bacterium]